MFYASYILSSLCLFLIRGAASSSIGTFTDGKCTKSHELINGPNGYPDGTCTPLNLTSSLHGFQVVGLDSGCSVTIYGPDDDTGLACSSPTKIIAELASCYNTSWVYYSIDGCDPPGKTPSPTPTSSSASKQNGTTNIGAIVGGIVGGVVGVALVIIIIFLCYRQRRVPPRKDTPPPPPRYELPNAAINEMQQTEKTKHTELYAHEAAVEMGRNSAFVPPAELAGDERLEVKKYTPPPTVNEPPAVNETPTVNEKSMI
ncbi:hypothetical protein BCR34DRAFT_582354 [Clohesyomyces aquaticus]|uniref:Mid2 domain-containing protein n=1 Tax=Clohesyomyces aquaticus TaxID=1231657 RepID=A0A1Y2AAY3_9PLEO|nr:hypothetical protein BCR34DRAFT_582354 [Clohesyomyces aquaticus]